MQFRSLPLENVVNGHTDRCLVILKYHIEIFNDLTSKDVFFSCTKYTQWKLFIINKADISNNRKTNLQKRFYLNKICE